MFTLKEMGTAKAKHDVKILMEDKRYSNFIKGHIYRYMLKENDVILVDEDRYGYCTDLIDFYKDFEIVK